MHVVGAAMGKALADLAQQRHAGFDARLDRLAVRLDLQIEQHVAEPALIETRPGVGEGFDMQVIVPERPQQIGDLGGHLRLILDDEGCVTSAIGLLLRNAPARPAAPP